jgi:ACS family hexuronate transporter-like MFS transporter
MESLPPTTPINPAPRFKIPHLRWYICGLLFFASTINYIDRQTISVLKPHLQSLMHWSESDYGWIVFAFVVAYAIMMVISGKVIDWLGTRTGFALAMVWWSLAAAAHAACRSVGQFELARFFLGAGEAANFPASIKSVAEWFPKRERALATGIFNSGTNIGAVVGTAMTVWLTLRWNWRAAFVFTGLLGFVWLVAWLLFYRTPGSHPRLSREELELISEHEVASEEESRPRIAWQEILHYRQAWGFIMAKLMTDPIWWFYIFWLPSYLEQGRGFSLKEIGFFAGIPPFAASVGSVAGGWLSGFWMKRGWSVNRARKGAMLLMAFLMPTGIGAVLAPKAWVALTLISVAMAAHQGWSANVFTLASDTFPKKDVGSVVGLGGAAGAVGGMILALIAGYILQWFHTYVPLFIIAGVMHPLAFGVVQLLIPRIEPLTRDAAAQS